MPIATIDAVLTVTPQDIFLQLCRGKGDFELIYDMSAFTVRVAEILREDGVIIGVSGPVIGGHERYAGLVATLTIRMDNSHWDIDMHSYANFKVGATPARRVASIPLSDPHGMQVDYPFFNRFAEVVC